MWKIIEGEVFEGKGFVVVTKDTEEAVGAFFTQEHAELFLGALEWEHWAHRYLHKTGGVSEQVQSM